MEKPFEQILGELRSIKEGQVSLETKVDTVDRKVDSVDQKVDTVDRKVDHLKSSLIEGLSPYFENVEKHIDGTTDKIISTLQKQQDSIDVLSARSIQQEADIKAFNRILKNQ